MTHPMLKYWRQAFHKYQVGPDQFYSDQMSDPILSPNFITEKPSDLYIQALKKARLKKITKKTLSAFVESDVEHLKLWQKILEQLVLQQMERERDLLTASPMNRYKRVLDRSPQIFQEIPNKYIANYLRMTPETLSRIKKS